MATQQPGLLSDAAFAQELAGMGYTTEQMRQMLMEKRAREQAAMTPEMQQRVMLARGVGQLGQSIAGLFGAQMPEDPMLKQATQARELQKQFDITTARGMADYAQALRDVSPDLAQRAAIMARDMGIKEAQMFKEQQAGMKTQQEVARSTAANQREDMLRGELAALPSTATDADVEAVVRKFGSPDKILASLERRQKAEADREAKMALEREKMEAKKASEQQALEFRREMAAASAAVRSAMTATQRELAQARLDDLKAKQEERDQKKTASKDAALNHAQKVIGDVAEASQLVGGLTTGLVGKGAAFVPGTDAYNLNQRLLTIKANLGFDRLQQMREASPTGGALGQVAVQELNALQSTVGSLDIGQDRKEIAKNLEKVEHHYNNWIRTTQGLPALSIEEYRKTKAPAPTPAATPPAPAPAASGWSIRPKQ